MPTVFARHPSLPTLPGVTVTSFGDLHCALGDSCVVADLSMGAWKGNHVAAEWCDQLGLSPPSSFGCQLSFQLGAQGRLSYANCIGELVDAETRGDASALFALRTAERLVELARNGPRTFAVVAPRFGLPWEPENELLIRFLAQGMPGRLRVLAPNGDAVTKPTRFCIEWEEDRASADSKRRIPANPWALFPGLLPAETELREEWVLPLSGTGGLIAPWVRPNPAGHSRLAFDALSTAVAGTGWAEAFAQHYGNSMFANCGLLCEQAQQRFAEGGYGVAFRLLDCALSCAASAAQKALVLAAMQGMRIAIHRFADAASAPDPPAGAPSELLQFLRQSKGWGLVMTGRAAESTSHFQAALDYHSGPGNEREQLYLRNIAALSSARLGDIEAALAAELDIQQKLAELPSPDWHLLYINSLNLARLYRRRKEINQAKICYQRAFATMDGARSDSDGLYVNLTFAQLETEAGNADLARPFWLRAALHWVSCDAPETLAWRVATAALGRAVGPGESVDEEVSAYLSARLLQVFPDIVPAAKPAVFARSEPGVCYPAAIGAPGWSVLLSSAASSPASTGPEYQRLRALLTSLLGPPEDFTGTMVVPDCHGREMPINLDELLAVSLECDTSHVMFDVERLAYEQPLLAPRLRVRLTALVSSLTPRERQSVEVSFKRYLKPAVLTGGAARLVAGLGPSRMFRELVAQGYTPQLIRSLEQQRILHLDLSHCLSS
jgi:tetratricopeptide (TPR) repeat protein